LKKTYKKVENKHEKALVAYKQHGFVEIFKRLWNENKVVQDNKKNIFVIAKNALSEVYSKGNREVRSDIKDKAEELYEKQKKIADKIKKLEKDIKNSKQQKKEVIQTFSSIGESVLSSAKTKANKAVEPIPSSQITYERTFGVIDKISKFSKKELGRWKDEITQSISDVFDNMRDSRLEKIEDRIVQKISDLEGDIDILDDDIQVLMEERDNAFRSYIRADKESEPEFYIENKANGGSQTAGGTVKNWTSSNAGTNGSFGTGGNGGGGSTSTSGGYGGGSGYYGGAGASATYNGSWPGGGGSSFISGHTGCVAITSSESTTARTGTDGASCTTGTADNLCSIHYSGKYFTNTLMIDGKGFTWTNVKASATGTNLMPNPLGDYYASGKGHTGNGYARITFVG